ncbi:MAG: MBL fold metallo-hydrolase [Elusimicrobia bacterium CG08_land_8_20_14_0_20_51_18]|nr:MAG: MBL fold metallo-hydrolase [Elusimicrobia bacterium CG08_land_8_20_14_0_20_51_18]
MAETSIKFCGAAGEVTGSRHLLNTPGGTLLMDCGLFQGHRRESLEKNKKFLFEPEKLGAALLSHAHIDHSGALPLLVSKGYGGRIYSTAITSELSQIMLMDSARLQDADARFFNKIHASEGLRIDPLYTEEDAKKALSLFSPREFRAEFSPLEGVKVSFLNSGHVLGSSMIGVETGGLKILYTGDIGRREQLMLKEPDIPENADYLVMETTYGNKDHENASDAGQVLGELIKEAVKNRSKILIPGFSLERTQEVIYMIDKLTHNREIPKIPVYVDSPMSVNVTRVFNKHINETNFNPGFMGYSEKDGDPFGYDYIRYLSTKEESQTLNDKKGPMVIISASGMCEGGRILHHIRNLVGNDNDTLLIVGYQAEGTLGRRLKDGAKEIRIFGMKHNVYFRVKTIDFLSAHAGMSDLLSYVKAVNPKKGIFLVHGEEPQRANFAGLLKKEGYEKVFIPALGEEFRLE